MADKFKRDFFKSWLLPNNVANYIERSENYFQDALRQFLHGNNGKSLTWNEVRVRKYDSFLENCEKFSKKNS